MGSKSNYLENAFLDYLFGGGDGFSPESFYIALFTSAPDDAGNGTEVDAEDWSNYGRVNVGNTGTEWSAASGGQKANASAIDFGTATIIGTAPVITHFAIFAADNTTMLYWGEVTPNKTIQHGDIVRFDTGNLIITED